MTTATTPPTPDTVARLMPAMAGYHDGFDWSVSMCVNGNVAEIDVTPGDGGGRDLPEVSFRAVVVEGDQTPIIVPRPDLDDKMALEGNSFEGDDTRGWQVVPYSSTEKWVCWLADADSLLIRGASYMPVDGAGHVSFAEARRMGAALIALADQAEAQSGGGLNA